MTIRQDYYYSVTPLWVLERLVAVKQPEALRLYVGLSKWTAGDNRQCHPSRQTIATYIGCSDRTVDSYIKALVAIGALHVKNRSDESGDKTSNEYTVITSPPSEAHFPTPSEAHFSTLVQHTSHEVIPIEVDPIEPDNTLVVPSEATRHSADEPTFDSWYDGYPVKKGKAQARKRWHKMTQAQRIASWDALSAWRRKADTEGTKYLPMASTFLNQGRWEDEHVAAPKDRSKNLTTLSNPSLQKALAAIDARQQGELEQ